LEEASTIASILTPVVIKVVTIPNVIITINNTLRDSSVFLHINLRWNNGGIIKARVVVAKPNDNTISDILNYHMTNGMLAYVTRFDKSRLPHTQWQG